MQKNPIKKIHIIIFGFVFLLILVYFILFTDAFNVRLVYKTEPYIREEPRISTLIGYRRSDEAIISEIESDPSLLNEKCEDDFIDSIDIKTPLITAIAYERIELAKYMITKGASVDDSIKILEAKGVDEYILKINKLVEEVYSENSVVNSNRSAP